MTTVIPSSTPTSSTVQEDYMALVSSLRDLGAALVPAAAARYEASPGSRPARGGIPNPTLDTVLDPRRLALSEAVTQAASSLRQATGLVTPHIAALRTAVARWEGEEEFTQ